jgi:hypothetical protein
MKLEIIRKNEPINKKEIENLENKFNITFSNDYKSFLLEFNGGKPHNRMVFKSTNERVEPFVMVEFYSLERLEKILEFIKTDTEESLENSQDMYNIYYEYYKNKMVSIGETYSNYSICICYSDENFGKIYCIDDAHEYEFLPLSTNFYDFINNFELVTENELETGSFNFYE